MLGRRCHCLLALGERRVIVSDGSGRLGTVRCASTGDADVLEERQLVGRSACFPQRENLAEPILRLLGLGDFVPQIAVIAFGADVLGQFAAMGS